MRLRKEVQNPTSVICIEIVSSPGLSKKQKIFGYYYDPPFYVNIPNIKTGQININWSGLGDSRRFWSMKRPI